MTDTRQPNHAKPSSRHAVVIGAGIAGIQAALDLAEAGFDVSLVERQPSIGGRMAQLDKTFPTLDCSSCILTPRMAEIARHPRIHLYTCAEVTQVSGGAGAFHLRLQIAPRYVDLESCTACGSCADACPVAVPNEFNAGFGMRKAIYRPFPQAVPAAYVIDKRPSPCKDACPAHIPVQGYIALIAEGKPLAAVERIRQAGVPFVGTLGRVCYHPCEAACQRGDWDEPVAICALKRFAYDAALEAARQEGTSETLFGKDHAAVVERGERVAIIGSGPAGLTAAFGLRRRGYPVTVFEALPRPGGMLTAGIPAYRLPREVLQAEIDYICTQGVEIRLNTPIGQAGAPSLEDLRREYQAVFVAIGAQGSSRLGIPGEDLPGVLQALPFLRNLNLAGEAGYHPDPIGRRVAVIGGGNSAVDAARSALRLGAEVDVLYRRSRAEMPAASYEVAAAEAEGVRFNFLVAPLRILAQDGGVAGIECCRMALGEPDASGRRRPIPIPGSEFVVAADTVIAAIGQTIEADALGLALAQGRLAADALTLATPLEGVFAGGDATLGPASVVEAIGAGLRAAESIDRYLQGDWQSGNGGGAEMKDSRRFASQPKSYPAFPPASLSKRSQMLEAPLAERVKDFREVEAGLTPEQALEEARRCLACAVCSECLQCVTACQRGAIRHDDQPRTVELEAGAIIVATGFDPFDAHRKPELGYGVYPEVITTLEFERLLSASGPTAGKIQINGRTPKKIVFIQCVGSRDRTVDLPNCSRVCCMAVAKQAHLAHERLPEAEVTVFYMDVRAFGKGFEEFYDRVRQEGVIYRRGNPSEIIRRTGKNGDAPRLVVRVEDTLLGESSEVEADLVVLAVGMQPNAAAAGVAQALELATSPDGYFAEADPLLQSMASSRAGIFLAGCCQGPKDIPDTVAQAKAAATAAMILLAAGDGYASN